MTIKASGIISISDISNEFGIATPRSLSQYYRGGAHVTNVAVNNNIPLSGKVSLSQYYGAVLYTPFDQTWNVAGTYTVTVPAGVYLVNQDMAGGGGGGSGGSDGGYQHNGPGGYGGLTGGQVQWNSFAVVPGDVLTIVVGPGGLGGSSNCANGNAGAAGGQTTIYRNGVAAIWVPGGIGGQSNLHAGDGSICGSFGTPTAGQDSLFGSGGIKGVTNGPGGNGGVAAGGGGGGCVSGSCIWNAYGGKGGDGYVRLWW